MILSTTDICQEEKPPVVSIVIPAYNAASYIRETLDSVRAQTFTDYEVIVVNDGSADREALERILQSHPLPIVYLFQENRGVSAARNAAIRIARGSLYAQLDADDQWHPDYLAVQTEILSNNPDVAVVYPNALIFGDSSDSGLEFMQICPSRGEVTLESLVLEKCIVMTCVTARMSAIKAAGTFDESCLSCEDFDLWLRITKNGGRIIYHRRVLARYRRHRGSLSTDRVWMTRNLLLVLKKAAQTLELSAAERKTINEQIAHRHATLLLFEGKQALNRSDATLALERFEVANKQLRNSKLSVAILLLRYFPRLLIWTFAFRERFLAEREGNLLRGIDEPRGTV